MFAEVESYYRRLRRRVSRSEWAIRHLGLRPSAGTGEDPGLLLIQIDGFARVQLERALEKGHMPFLRSLIRREGYETHTFYPGLPSTTPAVQAELFYGVRSAVPAFAYLDREKDEIGRMYFSEWAKAREGECAAKNTGLLHGGSSWSNIYTGGAGQEESHFCAASIGMGDMWRTGKIGNIFLFILLNLAAVFRIAGLLLVELGVALSDAVRGILHGRPPGIELTTLVSRVFIGVGLRELLTISGAIDVTRGLPIVHLNFVGYDEQAHARGPGSAFAHWSLGGIDRAIKLLYRAANRSNRRDYAVWIFSDHGQEFVRSYPMENPGGIEAALRESLDLAKKQDRAWRRRVPERPIAAWVSRRTRARADARAAAEAAAAAVSDDPFRVAALGPVGHVYFKPALTPGQIHAVATRLVRQFNVPGAIVRGADGRFHWLHPKGEALIPDGVEALLPHPAPLRAEIARDMEGFCSHPNAGDIILLGWSPGESWTFAMERGAHGGIGPHETQGFVLLPARTRLPAGAAHFIRPSALRAAALHHLGREPLERVAQAGDEALRLRLMSYNTHSCIGCDGRISPRRVARVIAHQNPDVVALQELDLGRRRSRAEDQAAIIAKELGYHYEFCPTVTRGDEHYGHAVLSRWPIELVKRALLPGVSGGWVREPRAALWVRVVVGGRRINFITTHLGLGQRERFLQMRALVGEEWIGRLHETEPVVLCGDFNCIPGSVPYVIATGPLRDIQAKRGRGSRPLNTFSSFRPFLRIDHIFISPGVEAKGVYVPRNELTRVASDHLPLMADLELSPAAVETTTRKAAQS